MTRPEDEEHWLYMVENVACRSCCFSCEKLVDLKEHICHVLLSRVVLTRGAGSVRSWKSRDTGTQRSVRGTRALRSKLGPVLGRFKWFIEE